MKNTVVSFPSFVRKIVQWKSTILELSLITEGAAERAFKFLMPVK
jgi:hypothetical protein